MTSWGHWGPCSNSQQARQPPQPRDRAPPSRETTHRKLVPFPPPLPGSTQGVCPLASSATGQSSGGKPPVPTPSLERHPPGPGRGTHTP